MNEILKTFGPAIIAAFNVFGVLFVAAVSCAYIVETVGGSVSDIFAALF